MTKIRTPRPLTGGARGGDVLAGKQCDLKLDLATEQTKSWRNGSAEFVEHRPDLGGGDEPGAIWLSPRPATGIVRHHVRHIVVRGRR